MIGNQDSFVGSMMRSIVSALPDGMRQRLWIWQQQGPVRLPLVGFASPQSLWRVKPISRVYGMDRGFPVDRHYIEKFLAASAKDIKGKVLEIADNKYTLKFGGSKVTHSEVLHIEEGHKHVTLVADLTKGENLPSDDFDCVICTQTLPFIFDVQTAVKTLHRILKPGGVLLVTLSGITKVSSYDMKRWGHYWNFTALSAERLFSETFGKGAVEVSSKGNVLAATAFLHGLASEELSQRELEHYDPDYEVIITARVQKRM